MSLNPSDQAMHLVNADGDILASDAVDFDPTRLGILCSGSDLQALEPRILLDAAAFATGVEALEAANVQEARDAVESAVSGNVAAPWASDEAAENDLLTALEDDQQHHEIVFIDAAVENKEAILAAVDPGTEIYLLDANFDGVEQIAQILEGREGYDAIHILSHGGSGALQLGSATLTQDSMNGEHADELAIIRDALSGDADILIYGCDFGADVGGEAAIATLSKLTGADVAASDDLTGSAELDADWDLETSSGTIEAQALEVQNFKGVLAAPVAVGDGPVIIVGDVKLNILVAGNDSDLDGDSIEIIFIVDPSDRGNPIAISTGVPITLISGTQLELLANGSLDVTTPLGSIDTETFEYVITDGNNEFSQAMVTLDRREFAPVFDFAAADENNQTDGSDNSANGGTDGTDAGDGDNNVDTNTASGSDGGSTNSDTGDGGSDAGDGSTTGGSGSSDGSGDGGSSDANLTTSSTGDEGSSSDAGSTDGGSGTNGGSGDANSNGSNTSDEADNNTANVGSSGDGSSDGGSNGSGSASNNVGTSGTSSISGNTAPSLTLDRNNDNGTIANFDDDGLADGNLNIEFEENGNPFSIVDSDVLLTDAQDNVVEIIVTLTDGKVGDVFNFPSILPGGITSGVFPDLMLVEEGTNTITLTAGPATTLADWNEALYSITFWPSGATPDNPDIATRHITFQVSDEDGAVSALRTTTVAVALVNDLPAIDLDSDNSGGANSNNFRTSYLENAVGTVIVDEDVLLSDPDNPELAFVTIVLTNGQANDVLEVQDSFPVGIVMTSDAPVELTEPGTSTITLTGPATIADFTAALKLITYRTTSETPITTQREIAIFASDGEARTPIQTTFVDVISVADPPKIQDPDNPGVDVGGGVIPNLQNFDGDVISSGDIDFGAYFFNIEEGQNALTITVSGLPPGLVSDENGIVTGTIDKDASLGADDGVYTVTVTADNGFGSIDDVILWDIDNVLPLAVGTIDDVEVTEGFTFDHNVSGFFFDPDGDTFSYLASGLPDGLSIDPQTGVISGRVSYVASIGGPNGDGIYTVNVVAFDGKNQITQTFVITAVPAQFAISDDVANTGSPPAPYTGYHELDFGNVGSAIGEIGGQLPQLAVNTAIPGNYSVGGTVEAYSSLGISMGLSEVAPMISNTLRQMAQEDAKMGGPGPSIYGPSAPFDDEKGGPLLGKWNADDVYEGDPNGRAYEEGEISSIVRNGSIFIDLSKFGNGKVMRWSITMTDGTDLPHWITMPVKDIILIEQIKGMNRVELTLNAELNDGSKTSLIMAVDIKTGKFTLSRDFVQVMEPSNTAVAANGTLLNNQLQFMANHQSDKTKALFKA